jgi:hypothetical protein
MAHIDVEDLLRTAFVDLLETVNSNTLDKDLLDWERWCGIMAELGEPAYRGNMAAHAGADLPGFWKETVLQAIAFIKVLHEMNPRSHAAPAAKPTSVTIVSTVRRIHSYFGITMASSKLVTTLFKAAVRRFIENHGLSAFMPSRKEPFTNDELRRMMQIPNGTSLRLSQNATFTVSRSCKLWRTVLKLLNCMAQTGLRLADALKLNGDAVWFELDGVALPTVNAAAVEGATDLRDFVELKVGQTKADQLGTYWAPFPVYLPLEWSSPINAAREFLLFERDFPTAPEQRIRTPLFADSNGKRLSRPWLEKVLTALMDHCGVNAATHSWHSFRIYLACALRAVDCDDSRIKAMVRWVSDQSLRIYARDSRHEYGRWLRKALTADVSCVAVSNLPEMDNDAAFAMLHELYGTSRDGMVV